MNPIKAAIYYLKQQNFKGLIYAIGSPILIESIKDAGFEVVEGVSNIVVLLRVFNNIHKSLLNI